MVGDEIPPDDADYILVVNLASWNQQSWYPSMDELPRVIFMKMEPGFMDPFWRDVDRRLLKAKIVHGSYHNHQQIEERRGTSRIHEERAR